MEVEPKIAASVAWLARILRTRYDGRARTIGLTRAQWRAIATISVNPGTTQREVANLLEINSVTAGRIIDRLEAAGLIERRPDPADRRANRIYTKPEAAPLQAKLTALALDEEALLLQGIDEAERAVLLRLLERMLANLQAAPAAPPPALDEDEDENGAA